MAQPTQSVSNTVSETSVAIAQYVMEHGRNVSDRTRLLERTLSDGRKLEIYFKRDITHHLENMPDAELRVSVTPVAVGQYGFDSVERGLNGRWIEYALRLDPPTGDCVTAPMYKNHNFIPMPFNVSELIVDHFQFRYELDLKEILKELSGSS